MFAARLGRVFVLDLLNLSTCYYKGQTGVRKSGIRELECMASRNGVNPNVDAPPKPHTAKTDWTTADAEEERDLIRQDAATSAAALDDTMTMQEADARREVPRMRTDAANPNKNRSFAGSTTVRGMLSSNMKKDYSRTKRAWVQSLPKTRRRAVERTMSDRASLEGVNRALHSTVGMKSELPSAVRRRIEATDRAIQDYERTNDRQHIVYATLQAPRPHGNSRTALRNRLAAMAADPEETQGLTFDGYIPATHSLGNVSDSADIVMEIRTRSGAYLGTSDTTPNSDHVVGRGRVLKPVGVHEVPYMTPEGSRGTRYLVQMDDVTPEERGTARS